MDENKIKGSKFENNTVHGETINIDNSTTIIINDYSSNIKNSRINFNDSDSIIHMRTKYENDRPRLESYYKKGIKEMDIIGFVACTNRNKIVIVNLLDLYGKHLAAHINVNEPRLKDYIGKLIKFKGEIYSYSISSSDIDKYGINVDFDTVEEISTSEHCYVTETPWENKCKSLKLSSEKFHEVIDEFIKTSINVKKDRLEDIKEYLNLLSISMFGVPNIIYLQSLIIFSMKDNLDNVELDSHSLKHLNIILTVIAVYITKLHPDNYLDMLKIVTYLVLVYLGYDILNPGSKNAKKYLFETCNDFMISNEHANYVINDYMRDIGGYKAIESYIPKHLRYNMFDLPKVARTLFVYRLLDS